MKLELQNKTKEIDIGGEVVTISGRISSLEKETIIIGALKNSLVDGSYNRLSYEESLYVGIIYHYTDLFKKIEGIDADSTPWLTLYDLFDSNGIIEKVIEAIDSLNKGEITNLLSYASQIYDESKITLDSAGYAIGNFAGFFGTTLEQVGTMMQSIVDNQLGKEEKTEEKQS